MPARRGFLTNIAIASAGTVAGQLVTLLGAPLVARFFGPEAFGVASVFGTLIAILAVVGCLRFDMAIPLPADARGASALLGLSALVALGIGALTALCFLAFGGALLQRLDAAVLGPWWWAIGAGVTLTALVSPLRLFLQRAGDYTTVASASVAQTVLVTVASVVVGLLGATSGVALVLTRTSVQLVALPMALVVVVVLRSRAAGWVRPRFADLRTVAGRYRDFPIFTTWAALLDMVGRQAPQLILAALFNASVVGLYAMAARLIALPASFLSTSVAAVFFQHAAAARAARQDERFRRDVLTVVCRLNTVGLPLVAAAALLGPPVVTVVFGQRWREAGQYVALLAPVVFAMFVTSPVTILFSVLELHRANIVTQGGMLTVRCIALWLGARFIGTPRGALALYALLVPLAAGVQQAWLLGAAGVSRRTYFGHLARHLLYLAPCLLGWLAMTFWTPLPDLLVAAIALVLGTSYVALAVHEDPAVLDLGHRALQRLGWRRAAQPPPPENELRPR